MPASEFMAQAIIVAGGAGMRFGASLPKQFHSLCNSAVLEWSMRAFFEAYPELRLIVVLPPGMEDAYEKHIDKSLRHRAILAPGGTSRLESVKNGLSMIYSEGVVGVHDAARPLVSAELIKRLYQAAFTAGNAIPVIPVADSLRKVDSHSSIAQSRSDFMAVQTPQCFRFDKKYLESYSNATGEGFTDDASVWEHAGIKVHLCEGDPRNMKITHPADLAIAEALLKL
jgi:2-C-methyl-D-erythritol 4-phosphate cytidylyltransferase